MDTTYSNLKHIRKRLVVPHSIPGLVTSRVMVMSYLNGVPLTKLGEHVNNLPLAQRKMAFKQVGARFCFLLCMTNLSCRGTQLPYGADNITSS
jgi:predicted unusual protein kinase regulating ubiquinone biosynthesis (AarF/ABC1/UbiB family)